MKVKCARCFFKLGYLKVKDSEGKRENSNELKANNCLMLNCCYFESESKTRMAYSVRHTGYLKLKESEEKRETSNEAPTQGRSGTHFQPWSFMPWTGPLCYFVLVFFFFYWPFQCHLCAFYYTFLIYYFLLAYLQQ